MMSGAGPPGDDSVTLEVRQVNPLRQRAAKWTDADGGASPSIAAAGLSSGSEVQETAASRMALDANDMFELFRSDGAVMQDHRSQEHPEFHVSTFVEQLVYQMMFPFSVPLIWLIRGWPALVNMRFVPSNEQTYIFNFQLFLAGSVFSCVGTYFATTYWHRKESAMSEFLTLEVIIVLVSAFFQRLPVATKWAYLPRPTYLALMRRRAVFADLLNDQIINGWADLSLNSCEVLNKELRQAQNRLGVDASAVHFSIPASKLHLLEAELCPLTDAGVDVAALLAGSVSEAAGAMAAAGGEVKGAKGGPPQAAASSQNRSARLSAEAPSPHPTGTGSLLGPTKARRSLSATRQMAELAERKSPGDLSQAQAASMSRSFGDGDADGDSDAVASGGGGSSPAVSGSGATFSAGGKAAEPAVTPTASATLPAGSAASQTGAVAASARVRISVIVLAKMLLLRANRSAAPAAANTAVALLVLCFVAALLPMLIRVAYDVPAGGTNAAERTQVAFSIIATFLHQLIYGQYLRVAATDFRRRADVLLRLGELCMNSNPRQARKLRKAQAAAAGSAQGATGPAQTATPAAGKGGSGVPGTAGSLAAASESGAGRPGPGQRAARKSMMLIRVRSERNTLTQSSAAAAAAAAASKATRSRNATAAAAAVAPGMTQLTSQAGGTTGGGSGDGGGIGGDDLEAGRSGVGNDVVTSNPLAHSSRAGVAATASRIGASASPGAARASTVSAKGRQPVMFARSGTPIIALAEPGNVVAFLITRRLLSVFGLRYFLRLQAYLSQAMLLALLIIVAILSLTLTERSPNALPATVGVASVALFLLTLLSYFLMTMLIWGARANSAAREHAALLASRLFEVRQMAISARAAGNPAAADTFTDTGLLIESAVNVVRADAELEPLRILSVPATFRLIQVIAISILSALSAGFNLLWNLVLNKS